MAKKKTNTSKKKWTKEMQMVKDIDAAPGKLSEEDKELGIKMANIMKWNRWTLILIVAGVFVGILGQMREIEWAYYVAIGIWAIAMACSYKYTKERNDIIVEHELQRKARRDAEKAAAEAEAEKEEKKQLEEKGNRKNRNKK